MKSERELALEAVEQAFIEGFVARLKNEAGDVTRSDQVGQFSDRAAEALRIVLLCHAAALAAVNAKLPEGPGDSGHV